MRFVEQDLYVARLHDVTRADVEKMVPRTAGVRSDFRAAIGLVVRAIHDLPRLLPDRGMENIEVYLGRSTEDELLRRWAEHRDEKQHDHGIVLFRTFTAQVELFEQLALEVLKRLHDRRVLCVRNIVPRSIGNLPDAGHALIYMTVGRRSGVKLRRPTVGDLQEIAEEVASAMDGYHSSYQVTEDEVLKGLRPMRFREPQQVLSFLPRYSGR